MQLTAPSFDVQTRLNDGTGGRGGLKKGGLVQLVQMGLGTIAGDIKEINLSDPRRTVVMEVSARVAGREFLPCTRDSCVDILSRNGVIDSNAFSSH